MNEKIVNNCRTLVALWDTFDDLHFMRIHIKLPRLVEAVDL